MYGWQIIVDNLIREAMEQGKFDNLEGKGKPLDLSRDPFEEPLAPTIRRILRDNGATHPMIEARRALENEIAASREQLRRAWEGYRKYGAAAPWEQAVETFRSRVSELNRQIRLSNLRSPVPTFQMLILDVEAEIERICGPGE